jgi:hypothetical protein
MRPIDATILDTLQRTGPCRLDDVVTSLSIFSWGEVFDAVGRLSRDGRVVLSQISYSTYQLSLVPQSHASSTSIQMGQIPVNMARSQAASS